MGELKKVFRPEFLNRIDEVIVFHKLHEGGDQGDRRAAAAADPRVDGGARAVAQPHRGRQGPPGREGLGPGDGRPPAAPRDPALHRGPAGRRGAAAPNGARLDDRDRAAGATSDRDELGEATARCEVIDHRAEAQARGGGRRRQGRSGGDDAPELSSGPTAATTCRTSRRCCRTCRTPRPRLPRPTRSRRPTSGRDVEIKVRENGPYRVTGPVRLIDADGEVRPRREGRDHRALPLRRVHHQAVLRQDPLEDRLRRPPSARWPRTIRLRVGGEAVHARRLNLAGWPGRYRLRLLRLRPRERQVARACPAAATGTRSSRSAWRRRPARGALGGAGGSRSRRAAPPGARWPMSRRPRVARLVDRDRRARPRARRRPRPRLARADRRLARASASPRSPAARSANLAARGPQGALRLRRGVGRAGQAARRAARRRDALRVPIIAETDLDAVAATLEARAPRRLRDRLGPDAPRRAA